MGDVISVPNPEQVAWVTGLVLGAANLKPDGELATAGRIVGRKGSYEIIPEPLGTSQRFTLYQCVLPDGRYGLLKIATTAEYNTALDLEAFLLSSMYDIAVEVEKEAREGEVYRYFDFFPNVVESFVSEKQKNRRVTVMDFSADFDDFRTLAPLSDLIDKENKRVDARTSVWILGKQLKTLDFFHTLGIANHLVDGNNILLWRERHGLVFFDWTLAEQYPVRPLPLDIAREEIVQAARWTLEVLGADRTTGKLPYDKELAADVDKSFEKFIVDLAQGKESSAKNAHRRLYEISFRLWGKRKFWPFTTYDCIRRKRG